MSEQNHVLKDKLLFKEICSTCGLPIAETKKSGAITDWIFEDNYRAIIEKWNCQCGRQPAWHQAPGASEQATQFELAGSSNPEAPILPSELSTNDMGSLNLSQSAKAMQAFAFPSAEKMKLKTAPPPTLHEQAHAPAPGAKHAPESKPTSQPRRAQTSPPDIVAGKWRIVLPLGFGQLGETYTALSIENNKEVVVKIMDRNLAANPRIGKRFLQECEKAASLHHKNIIEIVDFGRLPDGTPYVVSEHGDHTLASFIQKEGFLDVDDALRVADEICDGLIEAHKHNILHRGIKPENIIITSENQAKISDIGVAKALPAAGRETQHLTATSYKFADPLYMPPEQCQGLQLDERSDIYSLGCVLYQALTGKLPFGSKKGVKLALAHLCDQPRTFARAMYNCDIPQDVERVVMMCLEKDPKHRYKSIASLQSDLRQLLQSKKPKLAGFPNVNAFSAPKASPYTPRASSYPVVANATSEPIKGTEIETEEPRFDYLIQSKVKNSVLLWAAFIFIIAAVILLLPVADKLKGSSYPSSSPAPSTPLSYEPIQPRQPYNSDMFRSHPPPVSTRTSFDIGELFAYPRPSLEQLKVPPRLSIRDETIIQSLLRRSAQGTVFSAEREVAYKDLSEEYLRVYDYEGALSSLQELNRIQKHNNKNNLWTLIKLVETTYNTHNDGVVQMYADQVLNSSFEVAAEALKKVRLILAGIALQNSNFESAYEYLRKARPIVGKSDSFENVRIDVMSAYANGKAASERGLTFSDTELESAIKRLSRFREPEQVLFRAKAKYAYADVLEHSNQTSEAEDYYMQVREDLAKVRGTAFRDDDLDKAAIDALAHVNQTNRWNLRE